MYKNEKCRCKYICLIQNTLKKYLHHLRYLPSFSYKQTILNYDSIKAFQNSEKKNNDKNNKTRENIICAIINGVVPSVYFRKSGTWNSIKLNVQQYIHNVLDDYNSKTDPSEITNVQKIQCVHKGGRRFKYDFEIIVNDTLRFHIELKFNAAAILEAPQFVSPMKPSQYLSSSYEEYYYDHYLPLLSELGGFPLPSKEEYLTQIHSPKPECMIAYQDKYYAGCSGSSQYTKEEDDINFYKEAKKLSEKSIHEFIKLNELDIQKLSEYLMKTQKDKYYMLYKDNHFHMESVNMEEYELVSYERQKNVFIATSKSGNEIKILLRWKNGNGIAYPAFQIS